MDDNADAQRILLASPPANWRRQPVQDVPASQGSAPSNRISDITTLHSAKQQMQRWLRTALCGG